jgi:protein-S-isoprenylcysteine O-methyltransferase Ste14
MSLSSWLSIAGLLLWVGYELLLRRRGDADTAEWKGGEEDRRSTLLLFISYGLAVVLLIVLGAAGIGTVPVPLRWVGVAMIAAGLAVRGWGMSVLGRYYTRTLRVIGDQHVVQDGPYRLIRHPGYAGSLLVWTGYCLGVGNWVTLLAVAALMFLAYSWRIRAEERMLAEHFGADYRDYQRRTARLIPYLY